MDDSYLISLSVGVTNSDERSIIHDQLSALASAFASDHLTAYVTVSSHLVAVDDEEPPIPQPICQYCLANPRKTTVTDDPERRCPVCGADYTGPRRSAEFRALIDAGLVVQGD
jgi:hypothetical protein